MIDKNELPKSWEVRTLSEVCRKISLNGIKIKQKDYLESGKYPVVDQGQNLIGGYYNADELVIPDEPPYIIFGDHTKVKKFINFKFIAGADGVKVLKPFSIYDSKFFFYLLFVVKIPDKGYARHFQYLEKADIPLPPLAEQQRIVAKIEELFSELDAGVQSLKTAQAQLKTYRQAVLKRAFEGRLTNGNLPDGELPAGWQWVKLNDVANISGGLTKNSKRESLELKLPFLRVANVYFNSLDLTEIHTIGLKANEVERVRLEKNDLLFVEGNGSIEQIGRVALWSGTIKNCVHQNHLIKARLTERIMPPYALHFFCSKIGRDRIKEQANSTSGLHTLSLGKISKLELPLCSLEEQQRIVQEIESRLSVCDKLEETITASLQQAEALRQSILKKAFEGKLLSEKEEVYKPANIPFYQMQVLGFILSFCTKRDIRHGEMTSAKYVFLLHKLYGIPTYYKFTRENLGPYPSEIKKTTNNKKYFAHENNFIRVINEDLLFKYANPYKQLIENAIDDLTQTFSHFKVKERSHKTELLATVCKVIEDTQSLDIQIIRQSMKEWKIDLKTTTCKNKAEKFDEEETAKCVAFILQKGWDKKLIG